MQLKTLSAEDLGLPETARIMSVCLKEDRLITVHFESGRDEKGGDGEQLTLDLA